MTNPSTANNSTESRALELLASGIEAEHVAAALGVSPSRISQIASDPLFAAQLAEKRFESLRKHNATDNEYDALEKDLLAQLKRVMGLVMDPLKLTRILQVVNAAKRRGSSAPDSIIRKSPTIRLNIPVAIINRFAVNGSNQVVEATIDSQTQELVTIQSSGVQRLLNEHSKRVIEGAVSSVTNGFGPTTGSSEANGKRWVKPQGREKVDLLTECGFAHEIKSIENSQSS